MRLSPPPSLPFGRCLSMAPICASTRCVTLPRGGALLSLISPVWSGSTVRSQMSWRDKVGALVRCIATVVPLRSADGRVTLIRVELAEVPAALPCSGIRRPIGQRFKASPPSAATTLGATRVRKVHKAKVVGNNEVNRGSTQ